MVATHGVYAKGPRKGEKDVTLQFIRRLTKARGPSSTRRGLYAVRITYSRNHNLPSY